ncbi:MAG TPA: NAD(P)H-hydrate dehydratase [Candidatus Saccharimonadales bacterium]|nr:NAD(P)H-hydrate dehydratase [Candidatus Saccharimonadales bacterium]
MHPYLEIFAKLLNRPADSYKYQFGHVLVLGGSPGMVGAPLLSGLAALRTGAGLVTVAAAAEVTDKLERRVKELMTLSLPAEPAAAAAEIQRFVRDRKVSVMVVGPGLAVTPGTRALLEQLLGTLELPLIIDGGGLGALQTEWLPKAAPPAVILTPHTGEFQRLLPTALPSQRAALKPIAAQFAQANHVTLVLKGQPTYVAHSDGPVHENTTGNPGLATAGTGDVLSGTIAGLIAQHVEPPQAAEAAVYLHGLAGDLAADAKTEPGMIASDVIEAIPAAFQRIASDISPGK